MKKYELLKDDTITVKYHTLYRIHAIRTFGDIQEGTLGGYIENENNLSHDGNCWVYDNAKVYGMSMVLDNAIVMNDTIIEGNSFVSDNAKVCGHAKISDASVGDYARVGGRASVLHNSMVYGYARMQDGIITNTTLINDAYIFNNDVTIIDGKLASNKDYMFVLCNIDIIRGITFFKCHDDEIKLIYETSTGHITSPKTLKEFIKYIKCTYSKSVYKDFCNIIKMVKCHFSI